MPEKDPTTYGLLTYAWVLLLSAWGGVVNFLRKRKAGVTRPFNLAEMVGEIVTSAFAGLVTFYLCESSGVDPLVTAAMVGVSGHMGGRAIFLAEAWVEAKFGGRKS